MSVTSLLKWGGSTSQAAPTAVPVAAPASSPSASNKPVSPETKAAAVPAVPANGCSPLAPTGPGSINAAKVMIVDDEAYNIMVVEKFLEAEGYTNFITASDSTQAIDLLRKENPDLLLLDVMMPEVSGVDILAAVQEDLRLRFTPVIILTASTDDETKRQCLDLGATDFLSKPLNVNDLIPRVRNALVAKAHRDQLTQQSERLEQEVARRTAQLVKSQQDIILCLARAAEFRDNDTANHVIRVGRYVGIIARELGFGEGRSTLLEQAAQLHDVGKIGVPDQILLKPGKLTPEEFDLVKKHTKNGSRVLQHVSRDQMDAIMRHTEIGARIMDIEDSPVLPLAALIALTHHEKWDGTGYPLGLAGEDIPIEGRMTAVADVYDALSSERPYKPPFPRAKCFSIMAELREKQFDPHVLDAFFRRRDEIIKVQIEFADLN